MKTIIILLLILTSFVASFGQSQPTVKKSYDKFKDVTNLSLRIGEFTPDNTVSSWTLQAEYSGTQAVNPKIYLMLLSISDQEKFNNPDLTLLGILSNERVSLGKMFRAEPRINARNVSEILSLPISLKSLETLSKATSLEMQIGQDEFAFNAEQIARIKTFTDELKSQMPVKTQPIKNKKTVKKN